VLTLVGCLISSTLPSCAEGSLEGTVASTDQGFATPRSQVKDRERATESRHVCSFLESPASCEWYSAVAPAEIILGKAAAGKSQSFSGEM
jgi:hypothetical protein